LSFERDKYNDYNEAYQEAYSEWSQWLPEAHTDQGFYLGRQWTDAEIKALDEEGRKAVVYNKCRKNIKLITGYQRRNRLSSIIKPAENSDQELADIWSKVILWAYRVSHAHHYISEAFKDAIIPGISLMNPYMDFTYDLVNGDPRMMIEPYSSFLLDPKFTDQTLVDCSYLMRRRYVSREEAKVLLPEQAGEIDSIPCGVGDDDRKFPYLPIENNRRETLLAYDEFWQRTQKPVKTLIERPTGRTVKWRGDDENLELFLERFPFVKVVTTYEPTVERCIFLQDILMNHEIDPYSIDDYPFVPVLGDYEPYYDDFTYKLQGVIRPMRDPQKEFNKLRMSMTDISRSQANSGWIYELGSVRNPEDLGKSGQGVVIAVEKGGMGGLQKIPPGEIPQSLPALAQAIGQDIQEDAGISDELLGTGELGNTQISGTLAKERAYNSLTTLQDIFDGLNFSQQLLTVKMLKMIQANFTPEKIMRITEQEPPANFYDKDLAQFDITVEEGLLTDSQKAMHYVQLMQAKAAGINIPERAIIASLPVQDKAELLKAYDEEAQQAAQQQNEVQQQKELQLRLGNARVIKELSQAEQDRRRGVADEKLAVWRESEAAKNAAKADLDRVESIKKIQEMDINNVMRLLDVLQKVQEAENTEDRFEVKQDIAQADRSVAMQDAKATESADQAIQDFPPELLQALQQAQGQPDLEV
jgi:hypothetical protein